MSSWTPRIPEPADGRYVKVGDNPDDFVAVRADRPGREIAVGEWWALVGHGVAPKTYEELTRTPAPDAFHRPGQATVVALFTAAQAIEDLVAPAGLAAAERYRVAKEANTGGPPEPAEMAIRAFVNDLAARHGAPLPPWDTPAGPPEPAAREDDTAVIAAVAVASGDTALEAMLDGPDSRERNPKPPAWFAGGLFRSGRHRRPWLANLKRDVTGGGGTPKAGATG